MIARKDAILNPFLRKYIVTAVYRRILKEKNKAFDDRIVKNIESFLINFKNEKHSFEYRTYSKVIRAAEYYEFALEMSNQREMTAQSLKYSKDLLKIGYGLKPTPRWTKEGDKLLKRIKDKTEILKKSEKFSKGSHELTAYRMAFSVPDPFTKEEHEAMKSITKYVRN